MYVCACLCKCGCVFASSNARIYPKKNEEKKDVRVLWIEEKEKGLNLSHLIFHQAYEATFRKLSFIQWNIHSSAKHPLNINEN